MARSISSQSAALPCRGRRYRSYRCRTAMSSPGTMRSGLHAAIAAIKDNKGVRPL